MKQAVRFFSRRVYRNSLLMLVIVLSDSASAAISKKDIDSSLKPQAETKTAQDALALRKIRRVGIGLSGGGPLGAGGVNIELNFTRDAGFVGGFGGGPGYQAFTLQYKRVLGGVWGGVWSGETFLPYFAAGYSRWYTLGARKAVERETTPSYLYDRFLSEGEKASGVYALNLVYPALGIQYVQSSGPWAGSSVFFELLMLANLGNFAVTPTGTLGLLYYF